MTDDAFCFSQFADKIKVGQHIVADDIFYVLTEPQEHFCFSQPQNPSAALQCYCLLESVDWRLATNKAVLEAKLCDYEKV